MTPDDLEARVAALENSNKRNLNAVDGYTIYKVSEVAALLACKLTNAYDLISSGAIASTRIGAGKGGIRVLGSDILAFVRSRTTGGPRGSLIEKLRS